jgi:hypothetical protein
MILSESFALDATPIKNRQWPPCTSELIRRFSQQQLREPESATYRYSSQNQVVLPPKPA